ncbi:GNAT family N-acetyltransferase [Jatrophihabitans endophyticus]|nr:GNAT family N-acetyltransferase [Jatrophihabitans endophyticus]
MTDLDDAPTVTARPALPSVPADAALADAIRVADAAARASGVRVRQVGSLAELDAVDRLFEAIWQPGKHPPVTTELMRAFGKAGNYVAAAFDGETLVGACVGFFAAPSHDALHSHIAGVSPDARARSVGFALKLHQRAWALAHGVSVVGWTFDPLVGRNAYFNLVKLGARPVEYLPNFYGPMRDALNSDDDTDRLLVHWHLTSPAARRAGEGRPAPVDVGTMRRQGVVTALAVSEGGEPVVGSLDGDTLLVAVPADVEALRAASPAVARRWRQALRDTLGVLLADGAHVAGFDRAGWYVVRRGSAAASGEGTAS